MILQDIQKNVEMRVIPSAEVFELGSAPAEYFRRLLNEDVLVGTLGSLAGFSYFGKHCNGVRRVLRS